MPTLDIHIAAGTDDGTSLSTGFYSATGTETVVGQDSGNTWDAWFRFVNVTIPPGATIDVAYLTYVEVGAASPGGIRTNLYMNDEDSAVNPTDRANHVAKPRTSAFTAFDNLTGISTTGTTYNTPGFAAAVQEVLDRAGWASGNAMMVLWDNDGSDNGSVTQPAAIEHATYTEPILHIEYTDPAVTGTVAVTQDVQTPTAAGIVANDVTGTVAVTQTAQTSTASGNVAVTVTGTLAVTQAAQTSSAVGAVAVVVTGSSANTQQTQTGLAAGSVTSGGFGPAEGSEAEQGHRFEAWTLPNIGDFKRKFDLTRWVGYTFSHKWSTISDGRLDLPTDFPKLTQLMTVDQANHANDVGSIIRVLIGTTPINHYVLKGLDDRWSSEQQSLTGLLEGMDYYLDKARVPNFDAPTAPTIEPDWNYGAPSVLINTGLELSGVTSEVVSLAIDATGGSYKIGIDYPVGSGFVNTTNIAFGGGAADVAQAIETLKPGFDVLVTGAGTVANPFVIEVLAPASVDIGWATDSSLLTGLATVSTETNGGNISTDPWTRSMNPLTGVFHGSYTTFEISTDQAHSGTYSLKIDGDPPASAGAFPGAQQLLSVTPGRTFRASVWIYPTATAAFRLGIRTRDETWIATESTVLTAGSWQQISIPVVNIPLHVSQIIFRVATLSSGDEPAWYVDDALLAPGMPEATYGKIRLDLLTATQAEGVLTWVTPTWTAAHDSAGVVWDRNLQWAIRHGQTHLQLCEYAERWNYENGGIRWNETAARFEWDLFNPGTGGANKENSGFAVIGKMISESGTLSKRIPDATFFHTEGDAGHWGSYIDPTLSTAWGELQKFYANGQGLDTAGLTELATRLVADSGNRTHGLVTRLQSAPITPWVHFRPGDRNVMVNLAPKRAREQLRCMAIVATKGRDDPTPVYEAHWDSVVYQGEAAVLEQVRRLVRKFDALTNRPAPRETIVNPVLPQLPDTVGGGIFSLAAVDSRDDDKSRSAIVCDGINDEEDFEEAITFVNNVGGEIVCADGTYTFHDSCRVPGLMAGLSIRGAARAIIKATGAIPNGTDGDKFLFLAPGVSHLPYVTSPTLEFSNFIFSGEDIGGTSGFEIGGLDNKPSIWIHDNIFTGFKARFMFVNRGTGELLSITDNHFKNSLSMTGNAGIQIDIGFCYWNVLIQGNFFEDITIGTGFGVNIDQIGGRAIVTGNIVEDCSATFLFGDAQVAIHHNWVNGTWVP